MNAIPESIGHWRHEDKAFRRWLLDRGHEWFAKRLRAFRQYYWRDPAVMRRIGLTGEKYDQFRKLHEEFSHPRQQAITSALKRKTALEQEAAMKTAVPDREIKSRAFPKRYTSKGFAG